MRDVVQRIDVLEHSPEQGCRNFIDHQPLSKKKLYTTSEVLQVFIGGICRHEAYLISLQRQMVHLLKSGH